MPLTRPVLATIPRYVAGRNPSDVARESGITEAVKLASNEVPYGPLPGVTEAVVEAIAGAHRYPDPAATALRAKLGARYGVAPERIVSGCGSVALAEHLVQATVGDGDEVLYSWRSFEAYPIITTVAGGTSIKVPNTAEHRHDLDAMAAAVTERTKAIFICSPNNPTGPAVTADELVQFLDAVGPNVLVVLDEAYREFVRDPAVPDGLEVAAGRPNVVVLRTLSKAWGLAGIRVGWLAAEPEIAEAVRKVVTPFSVNHLAQAAAIAALDAEDEMARRVELIVGERSRVRDALLAFYPHVPESQANFVWLPLGDEAADFAGGCEKRGVIVRPYGNDGVRVSIGTPAENDMFLAAATELLA
jgi:histidinol-phosphate aminotransferase